MEKIIGHSECLMKVAAILRLMIEWNEVFASWLFPWSHFVDEVLEARDESYWPLLVILPDLEAVINRQR